ncbi:DUF4231 domain-containing protein [Streptomyces sp. NPDC127108]|uniref:DUF4231 domain-containing protein n=1 Tax=Streptomyces sp. NPDC127108 TaxID=3345361 RepID=UPI003631FFF3
MELISTDLLDVEVKIVDTESKMRKAVFYRRLSRVCLAAVPLLDGAITAAVVLFVDFSSVEWGRGDAIGTGVFALVVASVISIAWAKWASDQYSTTAARLRKLEIERRHHLGETSELSGAGAGLAAEYREEVPGVRDDYRRSAEHYRSRHNRFQLTVIVGSILTSVCTTAAAEQGVWSWLAVALSALVSISAGVISYFKFRERSLNLQQTADSIDLEFQAYKLGIRRYKGLDPDRAFAEFAEEIERIREEQRKKELQLEQPPEAGHGARPHATSAP